MIFLALTYIAASLITIGVVWLSAYNPDFSNLLREITQEDSLFENLSAFMLFLIGTVSLFTLFKYSMVPLVSFFFFLTTILGFLGFLEETSWTQHYFGFETFDFLKSSNLQQETNLHNLINPELFGSFVHASIYTFFIYIPLLLKLFDKVRFNARLEKYISFFEPSLHVTMMAMFGASLQAYFHPGALSDSLSLLGAYLILFLLLFMKHNIIRFLEFAHFVFLLLSTLFFILSYKIFHFENMQYEIREAIFTVVFTFWLVNLQQQIKKKKI